VTGVEVLRRVRDGEDGQGMVEYALIIALIAIMLIVGLQAVQGSISTLFTDIQTGLDAR
jgi:pilus assembly protein Flp/PilA